ncbi:MAG TPA: hypothetical protein VFK54_04770 [Candidatus Limnocylindrales bacterium]|nr:hypothetical protein [Candidatus Limnocylindrales bacterium]
MTTRAFAALVAPTSPARPVVSLLVLLGGLVAVGLLGPERAQPAVDHEPVRATPGPSSAIATDRSPPTLAPGSVRLAWGSLELEVSVPAGWSRSIAGPTLYKAGSYSRTDAPSFSVHGVRRVVADVCAEEASDDRVGPTVADLTRALLAQRGTVIDGPRQLRIGGYPGTRIGLTVSDDCAGSDNHRIWSNSPATGFGIMDGGTAVVYLIDVDGQRLVMTSHHRGASPEDVAELDGIVGSLRIARASRERILSDVDPICRAATRRFELEVLGLIAPEWEQTISGFRSLAEGGAWAAAGARIGTETLHALGMLPVAPIDRQRFARHLAELQPTIDILRAASEAAAAGDAEEFGRLMRRRVEETHRKDQLLGEPFWFCPVGLPA